MLTKNNFISYHEPTIGVDFKCKTVNLDNNNMVIKSYMWDTAGQEKFYSITRSYYQGIAGAIMMFDVGKRSSFERLKYWKEQITYNRVSDSPLVILILGNKTDKNSRVVSREEAKIFIKKSQQTNNNIFYLYAEVSCKNVFNINESFKLLVTKTYELMNKETPGDGIKRSIPYQESIKKNSSKKNRECFIYPGDECKTKCCVIL
jgi:small GTP-binding protein